MTSRPPNVAVLGGGMAGLAAAWRLTEPRHRDRVGEVTVYQRGWRLGGKAASHRGVHDRIEEHGLHIWLGYYDNAFRLMRDCYAELDRPTTDPHSSIQLWTDAFTPAPLIGLEDLHDGDWSTWTALFPSNNLLPGEPLDEADTSLAPSASEFLARSLGLMRAFVTSLEGTAVDMVPAVALAAGREAHRLLDRLAVMIPIAEVAGRTLAALNATLQPIVQDRDASRRLWHLADLVGAQIRGLVADDLLDKGFHSIDHIEYRDWISAHGASPETCRGALVRGLYDLAFSHRAGDPSDTAFPAGLGLLLSTKTFFDYKGSLFWKMTAGMGDTVIAPLYQALQERGVRFEFFHRVDDVAASDDGSTVERIRLGRQVRLRRGLDQYQPLQRYAGIECFPAEPLADQLDAPAGVRQAPLESFWCTWPDAESVTLERGRDFDEAVFAIPVGMAAHITTDLATKSEAWREMLVTLETIGTQGLQLWLRRSETDLGSSGPGSTVTSYVDSFDTFSSMSQLLPRESWPADDQPSSVVYLCSSMSYGEVDDSSDADQPARARRKAHADALAYLQDHIAHYLPNSVGENGFEWDLLCGAPRGSGPDALNSQYLVANVDPSDRYVQAIPGTGHARLRSDDSTFRHLHLAGDWTDNGLNAGCIEAAVMSGIQSANSVLGLPRWSGITGEWR